MLENSEEKKFKQCLTSDKVFWPVLSCHTLLKLALSTLFSESVLSAFCI